MYTKKEYSKLMWENCFHNINKAYNFDFTDWTQYLGVSKVEDETKDNILWAETLTDLTDVD